MRVQAVSRDAEHRFSKRPVEAIRLVAGLGVEGDAHFGATVQHRSRVRRDPTQPNLRQVHLVHAELFEELRTLGFAVAPGELGESVTTTGVDLPSPPRGALLGLGDEAVVRVTGLRNPCLQIDAFRSGLPAAVLGRRDDGTVVRKAGVMGIVAVGGWVRPGDRLRVTLPPPPHEALTPV